MKARHVKVGSHNLQVMHHAGSHTQTGCELLHIRMHRKLATESCNSYSRIATYYVTAMLDNYVNLLASYKHIAGSIHLVNIILQISCDNCEKGMHQICCNIKPETVLSQLLSVIPSMFEVVGELINPYLISYSIRLHNFIIGDPVVNYTVWRETLVVGKFGELSAKLPLVK